MAAFRAQKINPVKYQRTNIVVRAAVKEWRNNCEKNAMKTHFNSKPLHTRLHKPKGVKLARSDERRRTSRDNQRHDARPSKEIISKSSATLLACSQELLTSLLKKYGSTTTRHDLFKGLLKAKLSEKFRRMQRKHRHKALAVASALYHIIFRKRDPPAALDTFVQRMKVSPPRGSDLFRTIVECLFDYGSTAEERTQNRRRVGGGAH
jgi:hypothetical protein